MPQQISPYLKESEGLFDLTAGFLRHQTKKSALVEFWRGQKRIHASIILPERPLPIFVTIPLSQSQTNRLLNLVHEELRNSIDPKWMMWYLLAEKLIQPVIEVCGKRDIIYFAPHGDLFTIPFHAIPVRDDVLGDLSSILYVSTGTVLPLLAKRKPYPIHRNRIAVIGNPSRNLPHAESEAKRIASLFGVEPIVGREARISVLGSLGDIDILHIASHGYFDRQDPLRSGLVFYDGVLTTEKILQHQLRVSLVVLSACETARRDYKSGEELASLASAFLAVGAASVLATLWLTPDDSTEYFMRHFYQQIFSGLPPADALQSARQKLQYQTTKWNHPIYWAPYILLGLGR